jgi:hypothetical protein
MEAQFERDHCEPEQRAERSEKLKALLREARKLAPDVSDYEFLAALEERYRTYARDRNASARRMGRPE